MMSPDRRRLFTTLAGRRIAFTPLGFGGAPLGNMHRALQEAEAERAVDAAWESGVRYFDTAPLYGHGLSERRIGRALRGRPRREYVLSTKVGRVLEPCRPGEQGGGIYVDTPALRVRFDYTRDGVLRSYEASLERLGVDKIDIVFVHDLEIRSHGSPEGYEARLEELVRGGGWEALRDLRASGAISAIGLGVNESEACSRLLAVADPDIFLLAGRYTLLEQAPLYNLLPACLSAGVGVVAGGPYNSGVLARPDGAYDYAQAPESIRERVARLRRVCARFGASLPSVALQFAAAHPAVVSVIPGGQDEREVADNARRLAEPLPAALWTALKAEGLVDPGAPVPDQPEASSC